MDQRAEKLHTRLREWSSALRGVRKALLLSLGVALVAAVASSDELAGPHVSFDLLYMVPIALVTWFVGGTWGLIFVFFGGLAAAFFTWRNMPSNVSTAVVAWSCAAHLLSFGATTLLLWSLHRALETQRSLANTDPLTGIGNARAFRLSAAIELARCARQGRSLTAVYLDCDNFKAINDRFGHAGGDELLRVVAQTLRTHTRLTDHVARLGGDEFAVLLPEAGATDAGPLVAKLHRLLLAEMHRHQWPVTFSVGVATFVVPPPSADVLLARVDALQYRAKTNGKNRVVYEVIQPSVAAAA